MAKNMTRKGLALGAALALTTAGLVATPAQASDLSLVPSAGTGTSVLLSDTFTLHTAVTGNTNIANTAALKYEVVNASDATLVYTAQFWDAAAQTPAYANATPTATGTTTQIVSVASVTQTIGKVNKLTINPTTTATSTTFSVTVRSFSDLDSSGSVTSGDLVSPAVTITFHKSSDLTVTTALNTLVAGSAPTANVTIAPAAFNLEMTALANFNVTFSVNGAAATNGTEALNTAKTAIVGTSGANAAAGEVITAQAQVKSDDASALANAGSSVTASVPAASTATTAEAEIANSSDVKDSSQAVTGTNDVEIAKELRSGTTSFSYTMTFETAAGAAVPNAPVTIVASELVDALVVGESMTINGEKISGTVGLDTLTINTLTNASGQVTVAITAANAKNAENIEIITTSGTGNVGVYFKWVDAAIDDVYVANDLLSDAERTIVKGGSTAIEYVLVDQFKKPWTRADYNYRLVFTNNGTATNPQPLVLSNGRGTQTWVDNSTAASGSYTVTATLEDQTGTGAWSNAVNESVDTVINVVASAPAPAAIAVTGAVKDVAGTALAATGVPLAAVDLATLDNRVDSNTVAALGVANNNGAKLVATVTGSNGGNVKGASVTVSAAGVYFATVAGGSGVVTKDSITLNTATNGTVTVYAYSNIAGKKTITYTSGSVTKTEDVTWASAAAADGTAITLDVPASAKSGSTFKVTGKIVDKYGNPVEIATAGTAGNPTLAVSYAGPGLVSGSLPTTTSAAGEFVFYVLLGSNDSGSATVTASYDADGTTATKSAISASKTVAIGASAVATGTSVKRTGNTVAVRVTGANARIVLNGARVASRSTAGVLTRTLTLRAGRNVIQLVVGGEVVRTVRYTR